MIPDELQALYRAAKELGLSLTPRQCDELVDKLHGDGYRLVNVSRGTLDGAACGDMNGPHGAGGECVLPPGHPHLDGIGGEWSADVSRETSVA